jgi:EAL domain-containing protein (putative c-di-GMP-specific phosphodiesterase class I)
LPSIEVGRTDTLSTSLRDYQLDGLKIDRSYITDLEHGSTAIVDAIIRMSDAFGLKVIAEGIETEAQLAQLRALGRRFIQGYLVSRPVAPEDLPFMRTARTDPVADCSSPIRGAILGSAVPRFGTQLNGTEPTRVTRRQ